VARINKKKTDTPARRRADCRQHGRVGDLPFVIFSPTSPRASCARCATSGGRSPGRGVP